MQSCSNSRISCPISRIFFLSHNDVGFHSGCDSLFFFFWWWWVRTCSNTASPRDLSLFRSVSVVLSPSVDLSPSLCLPLFLSSRVARQAAASRRRGINNSTVDLLLPPGSGTFCSLCVHPAGERERGREGVGLGPGWGGREALTLLHANPLLWRGGSRSSRSVRQTYNVWFSL